MLGRLGDDDVGLLEQVDGADGQQAGVTRAAADERHPAAAGGAAGAVRGRWWSCLASCVVHSCLRSGPAVFEICPLRRRASPSPAGSRRPAASCGSPVADIRTESAPSGESATARTHSSSPSSPSTTSARAPIGAEQPPSSVASTARSASTAARLAAVVERGQRGHEVVVGAALDRQRTLPGGGQHLQRVEHLGDLVEPADPGQPGAGEDHGVVLPGADLARSGCRRCRERPRPPNRGRGRAAGRPAAGSRCRRGCRPGARRG